MLLSKIIKNVATSCQILRLKYTKFCFGWGSAPDPAGELTALPRPLAGFKVIKGPTSKMRGGKNKQGEGEDLHEGERGRGRVEEEKGEE